MKDAEDHYKDSFPLTTQPFTPYSLSVSVIPMHSGFGVSLQ